MGYMICCCSYGKLSISQFLLNAAVKKNLKILLYADFTNIAGIES